MALGAEVVQHFWPDWDLHEDEDAAVWLRGKRRCTPRPDTLNAIWILSHPGTVTANELNAFDVIYAGSNRLAEELDSTVTPPVEVLRQCTDTGIFTPDSNMTDHKRQGLLFVANSRGVRRPMLEWALSAGLKPCLIGQGWQQLDMGHLVLADHIENTDLPALYANARYGMNDHWGDMAYYQIVNNRVFDCLASGLPLISDGFPELTEVAAGAVQVVDSPRTFRDAYWELKLDYAAAVQASRERWEHIGAEYTFDARARQILECLELLPVPARSPSDPIPAAGAVEWAEQLLEQTYRLERNRTKAPRSLLHACPKRESSGALTGMLKLSTISAGSGPGPWNARLDEDLAEIHGRQFDIVYVEDADQWKRAASADQVLDLLAGHVKLGGFISASDSSILQPLLADRRFATVSSAPLVLRRTVENLLDPPGRIPNHLSAPSCEQS